MIYGHTQNYYESVYTSKASNRNDAGLAGLPDIYTTNRDVNPAYFMAGALPKITAPFYVNGKIELPQQVTYGTRSSNTPQTPQYPGWFNINQTWDLAASLTHVRGSHTFKTGFAINHSFKAQNMTQAGAPMGTINFGEDSNNPNDTQFGYSNIAIGTFGSYNQASKFVESGMVDLRIRAVHSGQLEGLESVHAGLRRAVRPPPAGVREGTGRRRTSSGEVDGLGRTEAVRARCRAASIRARQRVRR